MVRAGLIFFLGILLGVVGCGGGGQQAEQSASSSSTPTTSPYDQGPRASEAPINQALAEKGADLFKTKTCSTCHGFGIRITGPDLKDVPAQRTARWMQQQIQHPDIMTKQDPISRQLLGTYAVQMPNLNITDDEARALIEYIKKKHKEMSAQ
jgi:cytochrome c551/c552